MLATSKFRSFCQEILMRMQKNQVMQITWTKIRQRFGLRNISEFESRLEGWEFGQDITGSGAFA